MHAQSQSPLHAVMVIWHGIVEGTEVDYLNWHTSEHMPERLGIPGFLRGRRSHSPESGERPYITIYEADDVSTFGSLAYLERLNSPTPWSQRNHPHITHFIRGACDVLAARGFGIGRSTLAMRLGLRALPSSRFSAVADELCEAAARLPFVTSARFCLARHDVSGAKTKETELRGTAGDGFDAVLLVDSHDAALIRSQVGHLVAAAQAAGLAIGPEDHAVYDLCYLLDAREPRGSAVIPRQMP